MEVPQLIANRYEIKDAKASLLGTGGMGAVYRGVDTTTQETVAIKQLRPDIVDKNPDILVRFQREGEVLRRLQHPNIVAVLETVEYENTYYIIMEYVPGGSLRDLMIAPEPIPIERTLSIALELADALSRSHHQHVIHRDIKPANVLIAEDGTPRLTDFGIARIGDSTRMTQDGTFIGTVSYLAPEGFAGELDARSDVWAFGVLLFEMLTGKHPFEVDTVAQTITAILTQPPPDLSQLSSDLPPTLVTLVENMLKKQPGERTSSMRLIAAQLEAIIAGDDALPVNTPIPETPDEIAAVASQIATYFNEGVEPEYLVSEPATASDDPTVQLPTKEAKSRFSPRLIAVATVLLVGVVGIIAVMLVLRNASKPAIVFECDVPAGKQMVIVADLEPLDTERTNPTRFIIDDLHQHLEVGVPFSELTICRYPAVVTTEEEALELAREHQALVVAWGSYTETCADVQLNVGYPPGFVYAKMDRETLELITNTRSRIEDPLEESIAPQILGVLGTLQNDNGDGYGVARTIAITSLIDAPPAAVLGNNIASHSIRYFNNFTRDEEYALDMVTRSVDTRATHIAFSSRSGLLLRMGDLEGARRDAETALLLGPEGYAMPYYILANIVMAEGDFETAIEYYSTIIDLRPDDWFAVNYRGAIHYLIGDYERAREDLERAIELGPDANFPYMLLLMLSIREGDLLVAQETMETVLHEYPDPGFGSLIVDTIFGDEFSMLFAPVFSAFGNLTLGQYEEMLEDIDEAVAIEPNLTDLYMMRGYAHCNLDDNAAAEEAYTQAIELESDFTALYVFRAEVRLNLGRLIEAAMDVATVLSRDTEGVWSPIVAVAQDGSLNCKNLLNYDLSSLYSTVNDE